MSRASPCEQSRFDPGRDELRSISRAAALVLGVVTLAGGLLGFGLLQARVDGVLQTQVSRWVSERRAFFELAFALPSDHAVVAAADSSIGGSIRSLHAGGAEVDAALRQARAWASSLEPHGFTAIALETGGRRWPLSGSSVQEPDLSVPLRGANAGWLLWKDGFHLRRRLQLPGADASAPSAVLVMEQKLNYLNRINRPQSDWGASGEILICAQLDAAVRCFPSRHNPRVFTLQQKPSGEGWSVQRAIAGEAGIATALDYRGKRVIEGFGPVGDTGIGLVAKMDSAEIYSPIREELQLALLALALLVLLGLGLLRLRLSPLLTALARSREQLSESQARVAAVIDNALDAFLFLQPVRAGGHIENFRIELVNGEAERMLSQPRGALVGRLVSDVLPRGVFDHLMAPYVQALTEGSAMLELELPGRGGRQRWLSHQLVRSGGGLAVTLRDITEDRQQSEEDRYRALHDGLTGLLNRAGFEAEADALLARTDAGVVAFAMFDVDGFKQVNDHHGHEVGDALLRAIAQRLVEQVRPDDIVARLGGDEFVLAVRDPHYPRGITGVAENLVAAMARPFQIGEAQVVSGISLGACAWPMHGADRSALVRCADVAMYRIKRQGRNGSEIQPPPT